VRFRLQVIGRASGPLALLCFCGAPLLSSSLVAAQHQSPSFTAAILKAKGLSEAESTHRFRVGAI